MSVGIDGDLSKGISSSFLRVPGLCPLGLTGGQKAQGSPRHETAWSRWALEAGGLREDWPSSTLSLCNSVKKQKHPGDNGNAPNHSQTEYLTKLSFDFF